MFKCDLHPLSAKSSRSDFNSKIPVERCKTPAQALSSAHNEVHFLTP
jgi:hypothetical protein